MDTRVFWDFAKGLLNVFSQNRKTIDAAAATAFADAREFLRRVIHI